MKKFCLLTLTLFCLLSNAYGSLFFEAIVLGARGGPLENNMSGYLLSTLDTQKYVSIDAGSLLTGIQVAKEKGCFADVKNSSEWSLETYILREQVRAYLITHAHLDHIAGLVLNSTIDTSKPIYGLSSTLDFLRDHLFNWKIWPNFGSEGSFPILNQYCYSRLTPQNIYTITDTGLQVQAYPLSHPGNHPSSAFFIESNGHYVLFIGDTSPDSLEKEKHLKIIWEKAAPLVNEDKLAAIFIECSYPSSHPANQLYGHLNTTYLLEELFHLASLADPENPKSALSGLKVIVTHIKESLLKDENTFDEIKEELQKNNDLGVEFILAEQGNRILL